MFAEKRMGIQINHAILHILDGNSGVTVFSDQELDLVNSSVCKFLLKHLERTYQDAGLKTGDFQEASEFEQKMLAYLTSGISFRDLSVYAAERVYEGIAQSDKIDSSDLLVCDCVIDESPVLALLKCNNKMGYTHQVAQDENGICNEIINHYAILPGLTQRIEECAFVGKESRKLRFMDKKRSINGTTTSLFADVVLHCTSQISPKESVKRVKEAAESIAERFGADPVNTVAKVKTFVAENLAGGDRFEPEALGRELFRESDAMREEYMREIQEAGVPERVYAPQETVAKAAKNHRIKTDTGIELSFPADYFEHSEYIQIVNQPDGTISIQLNHIGKIMNK